MIIVGSLESACMVDFLLALIALFR